MIITKQKDILKILPLPFSPGHYIKQVLGSKSAEFDDGNTGWRVISTGEYNNETANENFRKHFCEITDFQNRDKLLRMRILECLMMNAWSELSESTERNENVIAEIEKTSEIICVEGYCVSSFMRLWSSYDHSAHLFRMSPNGKTTVPMSTVFGYFTTEYGMEYAEEHMKNTVRFWKKNVDFFEKLDFF